MTPVPFSFQDKLMEHRQDSCFSDSDEPKSRLECREGFAKMKQPIPIFPLYLGALFFITRSSASRGKTVMWMLITLVVTIAGFVGLAGFVSSPEAAYGLGGLGSLIGMVASVAVGLKHMLSHKRPAL
jgi:hypothetical protein